MTIESPPCICGAYDHADGACLSDECQRNGCTLAATVGDYCQPHADEVEAGQDRNEPRDPDVAHDERGL